jgi:hypothetical protein
MREQLTGEPVAGEPHTGFGGRGRLSARPDPYTSMSYFPPYFKPISILRTADIANYV